MSENKKSLLVIGAGIAGITAALEAAETGAEVVLIEREAAIGGRVLRLNNYFPKMCPRRAAWRSTSAVSSETRESAF